MCLALVAYPVFILETYNRPVPSSWAWLLYLLTANLAVRPPTQGFGAKADL